MRTILFGFEPGTLSEAQLARVQALAPDMRILVTRDRDEIESVLDEIEIAAGGFPRDLLPRACNLRWLQQWGAGADWLLRHSEAVELDFVLTNASGVHPIPISEHILAFLLAFGRGFHRAMRAQARHEWFSYDQQKDLFELVGKTMVLVGVGAIGKRTAQVAAALGIRVLGVRRNPAVGAPGVEAMFGPDQLLDLLPEADFVVLTVPLTHETQGMIGERELRAMKPTAYLVNIGRGGTVQERALIRALQEGWIAGAGLDVFETEPLPEDSPLWDMDNVIITAHYAGATPHYNERAMAIFLDNLRRYRAGEPLRNVVDKRLGY
ncbi:MAG: D-2-hydroxyacid dehydrogenase [Chloroflexi bacterium]|nr:MAG: D-2-hydroxyacid dehydrogenase [Chloroflexota bacterium]